MSARVRHHVQRKVPAKKGLSLVETKQKKVRRRLPWLVIVGIVCAFSVIFGVLLARVVLVKSSFKLQQLQERLASAEELHEELMLEAAKMESPARIERVARSLGMIDPATVNYIVADLPRRAEKRFAYGALPGNVTDRATVASATEGAP